MNIIVVSNRLAKAVTLGPREIALLAVALAVAVGTLAFGLGALFAPTPTSALWKLVPGAHARQSEIDALARRLGEVQAKLIRLDGLMEHVGKQSGINVAPYLSTEPAPRGGPSQGGTPLSAGELAKALRQTDDKLTGVLEQLALADSALTPSALVRWQHPLPKAQQQSSSFGWRLDPFTGRQIFHEGLDMLADVGTPIHAAGPGTVIFAAYHYQYGNMVDLDHGNGLVSRYAHSQRLNVKDGEIVKAGQVIAFLGNSGQSTGPHLHFELRYKGVPQNPLRFLAGGPAVVDTARVTAAK